MTRHGSRRFRWALCAVLFVGLLIAAVGFEQAVSYDGTPVDIPGLPGAARGLHTYPWFYYSIWPTVRAFALGVLLIIGALTGLRLSSSPRLGGHFIWAAIAVTGVGVLIQFVGIELAAYLQTGFIAYFVGWFGIFIVLCALPLLIAGLVVSLRQALPL